jgi:hypothetical protein
MVTQVVDPALEVERAAHLGRLSEAPNRETAERTQRPAARSLIQTMSNTPRAVCIKQAAETADDIDWATFSVPRNLQIDTTAILVAADRVASRARAAQPIPRTPSVRTDSADAVPWPPGAAGEIARFMHRTSYSPIAEVSITAVLGLLAGVCGRAYRTPTDKDLALYLILVAKSGVGKDHLHEAIPMMLRLSEAPLAEGFCRAQDFVSGEALHKEVLREPGFLYLQGEFGRKLKRMSNPQDTPMQSFRTTMLNAYGKRYMEGKSYSRAEDSLIGVEWPALSFLGETTPGTFLECLTEDMMADGFLSRFLVISYGGDRPMPNRDRSHELAPQTLRLWRDLVDHALRYQLPINAPLGKVVQQDEAAAAMLDGFEVTCIHSVNATDQESERQVWSRAHLKAQKVASLLAVADHHLNPTITAAHADWAIALVLRDVEVFQSRYRSGDVGLGDDARVRKLASIIRSYITAKKVPDSYKVPPKLHEDGLVPRAYLQIRTGSLPSFTNHRQGQSQALESVLRTFVANGYLMDAKQDKIVEMYGYHGKTYRVLDLPS